MSPVLWLIAIPLITLPLVYLLRRTIIGGLLAAGVAFFLAWLTTRLPLGLVITLLGRPVELNQLSQITLVLLFGVTAILFLVAAPPAVLLRNVGDTTRGRTFHTIGLATLSVFTAASLSRHLGFTAMLVEIAAIFTVLIIQGRRLASTRAAQRFLVLMSLAVPLFLLAAWRIDQYQLSGGLQTAVYLQQTALLIGLGFALWLAVWPFHSWQSTTAGEASPPAAAFVLIAFPIVAFSSLLNLLTGFPWLFTTSSLAWMMVIAGGVTTVIAGILAAVQRGFSPLVGYTAMFDLGLILAVLGVGGPTALLTILVGLTVRALALALIAAGLLAIRRHAADDGFVQVRGLARQLPLATGALMLGGLTLLGLPFTLGFPWRWQLLHAITQVDSRWPLLLILAGLGVSIGYLRGLKALLSFNQKVRSTRTALTEQEPLLLTVIIVILAAACIVLSIFPSLLIEPLQQLTGDISIPLG